MNPNPNLLLTFFFSVLALVPALIVLGWGFRLWRRPQVEFLDLVYDKASRQLELFVVNPGEKPIYVSPSLRMVHFLDPEEWREKNSNGNGCVENMLAGKSYQVESVIKGYTLIGECMDSVMVDGKSIRKIVYPVGEDISLSVCDNIRVDSSYGVNTASEHRLINTMRVMLKEEVDCSVFEDVPAEGLTSDCRPVEGLKPALNPGVCLLPEDGKPSIIKNAFPVEALCVCCGSTRLLEWVVGGNHVCGECKQFLGGDTLDVSLLPEDEAQVFLREPVEVARSVGSSAAPELSARQAEILSLLGHENNLTVKKLSRMLGVNESTASAELKALAGMDLVGRIKVKRRFLYHLA